MTDQTVASDWRARHQEMLVDKSNQRQAPDASQPAVASDWRARHQEMLSSATRLQSTLESAASTPPDQAARAHQVARDTGLPVEFVTQNLAAVQAKQAASAATLATKQAPITASTLQNSSVAQIAHDNVENMSALEGALAGVVSGAKYLTSAPDSKNTLVGDIGAGVMRAGRGLGGAQRMLVDPLAGLLEPIAGQDNLLRQYSDSLAAAGAESERIATELSPPQSGLVGSGVSAGVQSLTQNLIALPMALLPGGQPAALGAMAGMTAGGAYQQAREQGLDPLAALPFAVSQGSIEYATERIPVARLFGDIAANTPFFKMMMRQFAAEVPGEQVATLLQDLNEWAVLPDNRDRTFADYLSDRPSAAAQTFIATLVATGAQTGALRGINRLVADEQRGVQRVDDAQTQADALAQLSKLAAQDKLRARAPEVFEDFVTKAAANGPVQTVFIDASTLQQSGVADQVAALSPSVAAQLPAALATGGQVAIPVGEYLTRIAPTEYAQSLQDHVRTDPEGFSRAEAEAFNPAELQAETAQALAEAARDASFRESADTLRRAFKQQLDAVGRWSPEVNDAYASLVGAFYTTQAARLNITPAEFAHLYPLRIVGESVTGERLDQALAEFPPKGWKRATSGADAARMWTGEETAQTVFWTDIQSRAQETEGYSHSINKAAVAHIKRRHGDQVAEQAKGQIAVTNTDLARIPEIVASPDATRTGTVTDRGLPAILYAKNTDDGTIVYVESISRGRKNLAGVSMWKYPSRVDAQTALERAAAGLTSEAGEGMDGTIAPDGGELNQSARGSYSPLTNTIALLKDADLSTFLHELGHHFLEIQADIASQPDAPAEMQADMQTILDWLGVADLAAWQGMSLEEKRPFHEQWARGTEMYFADGKAPTVALQGVFQRFRAWLLNVYRQLTNLNVDLSDEVRAVMGRMLATNEQILQAEAARRMNPLFATAADAGMTAAEFQAYRDMDMQATQEAAAEIDAKSLRDMTFTRLLHERTVKRLNAEARMLRADLRAEIEQVVNARPVYRADRFLRTGELEVPAGANKAQRRQAQELGLGGTKLSLPALKEIYGEEANALWRYLPTGPNGLAAVEGLHPDMVAEIFGYTSGDQMIRELLAALPRREAIEAETDRAMLERYGDVATPEAIARAADEAIHNDVRLRVLATEVNALARATGSRRVLADAARDFAAREIGSKAVGKLDPRQFTAAEAKAARASEAAFKAGNIAEAATQKRHQFIQAHAARAAYEAQAEVTKITARLRKIANTSREKVAKSRNADIAGAAQAILAQYGLGRRGGEPARAYMQRIKDYDASLYDALEPALLQAEANAKPLAELTVDELRGLADSIESLWTMARRDRVAEIDGKRIDLEAIDAELLAQLEEIGVPERVAGEGRSITDGEERIRNFTSAVAAARRVESWVDAVDGDQAMGPFRRYIFTPIKEAADAYRTEKAKRLKAFRAAITTIAPTLKPIKITASELPSASAPGGYVFGHGTGGSAMNEILHALLHTGNESNKRKLLLGRGWASERSDGTLDTSRWDAFIARMIAEGHLTKAHYDFAQAIWDQMEDMKPLAQKAHRQVFGHYFDEITAQEFVTPFGTYRGGYVPAIADPRIVDDARVKRLVEQENETLALAMPSTARGFTKGRVEYNRPLMLDMRTLAQHIDKVALFSHMEVPLRDVRRILSKKAATALSRIDPNAISIMLVPWLNRAARQQVETPVPGMHGLMRNISVARARAGAAVLFANITNTAQQVSGFLLAGVKVRPSLLLSATADYIKGPAAFTRAVADASIYMASRMENEVAVMMDGINDVLLNPTLLQRSQDWSMRHAYFMQSAVDNVMSPIIWTGAYNQALEAGSNHKDAVRLADAAVRQTQGSSLPEDVSRLEAGNAFWRLFTQFAGYFNMWANLLGTEFVKLTRDYGLKRGMGRGLYLLTMGYLAPVLVNEVIVQAFRGGPEDEDKDGIYLDDWLMAMFMGGLRSVAGMVPFVGPGVMGAINAWNDKPYDDRIVTPLVFSMIETSARALPSLYSAVTGDGSAQRAVRDVSTLLSITLGVPAYAVSRPIGYAAGVAEGRIEPTGPFDAARGFVTGVASPESRER